MDIIAKPLGQFLYFIYSTVGNYGLAIIIFTIVVKLVLLPLTVKQYRSTGKMQQIQPQIQEIQKRHKNDKEKLNQELMKVYKDNEVNPAGGCLPMLVQMPILFSLYWVITQPLKFMLGKTQDQITELVKVASSAVKITYNSQLQTLNYFFENNEALSKVPGMLSSNELINFNFIGLHLGETATYHMDKITANPGIYLPLLLLTIIGVITTYISTKLSMPQTKPADGQQNAMASSMSSTMMYIGPVMTLIFSFQLPAGVLLYWIAGYVFQIFQQLYINKHILKKNVPAAIPVVEAKAIPPAKDSKQTGKRKEAGKKK